MARGHLSRSRSRLRWQHRREVFLSPLLWHWRPRDIPLRERPRNFRQWLYPDLGPEDKHAVGMALGTFTVRFPLNCSRVAPYVWAGGGGIFGGGRSHDFFLDPTQPLGIVRREFDSSKTKSMAQVGGGFEVRISPH